MKRVLISVAAAAAAFLAGFVPTFLQKQDVQAQLAQSETLSGHRLLRLQLAQLIVEVEQGRAAHARDLSTGFFDRLRDIAETARPEVAPTLQALLGRRDEITADLVANNSEVSAKLRAMFVDLSQALPEGPAATAAKP
ncbi:MAG: hypothetical protein R2729_23725 [Bryobacteraceae bacterium]